MFSQVEINRLLAENEKLKRADTKSNQMADPKPHVAALARSVMMVDPALTAALAKVRSRYPK